MTGKIEGPRLGGSVAIFETGECGGEGPTAGMCRDVVCLGDAIGGYVYVFIHDPHHVLLASFGISNR